MDWKIVMARYPLYSQHVTLHLEITRLIVVIRQVSLTAVP
jgi:hypothetical protein